MLAVQTIVAPTERAAFAPRHPPVARVAPDDAAGAEPAGHLRSDTVSPHRRVAECVHRHVFAPGRRHRPFVLHIVNGNPNGTNRVSSARVTLNGTEVAGPTDFNQNVAVLDRPVSLQAINTLDVRLTSAPGSVLTISVLATSPGPQPTGLAPNPLNLTAGTTGTLTATLAPAPTAAGSLPVSSSAPGVATVPASVPFAVGQTSIPVPVTAVAAGTATITVTLNGASAASQVTVVPPPPTITGFSPTSGKLGDAVTITGTNFVNVQSVTFAGVVTPTFTVIDATSLVALVPVGATTGPLTVTTPGGTVTSATTFTVLTGPVITSVTPTSGPAGTAVMLSGQNFDPVNANNQINFNGTPAIITSASATLLTTTVPQTATTGLITVTTPQGTATSAQPFTVTASQSFTLSAAPAQSTVLQGGQGTYALSVTGSGTFSGLVTLSVTGLPAGVTAQFSSPMLAPGQTAYLTLTAGGAVPAGAVGVTLTGTAPLPTGSSTQSIPLTLAVLASGGQTAVSGQFLNAADGKPIPNVQVKIGTIQAQTDAAGAFLLQNAPSGLQQLVISGTVPTGAFMYNVDVPLTAGQTNVLPPFWVTPQPPAERFTPITNATQDQVFTDPRFPGLSLTLPAGVTIIGWDNVPKTQIALERLDLDRLGVPPPPVPVRSVYQPFFGTPMGGFLSPAGTVIPVSVPNDLDLDPGQQTELWVYDASPLGGPAGWKLAGLATVSQDGTTIVSNPGVGITRFCFKCGLFTCVLPFQNNGPNVVPGGRKGGEPVDLQTGLFTVENTDLVLPGRFPLTLARTYNHVDPFAAIGGAGLSMGLGWALSVDVTLVAVNPAGTVFRVVLPGNSRLDLAQQPDGTFTNRTHPLLKGAVLRTLPGGDHQLRFKDGTTWRFRPLFNFTFAGAGQLEFLIEQSDRHGNRVTIERVLGGGITRIVDAAGRVVTVSSSGGRITQLQDPLGRTVSYAYGANGRLATVTDPAGGVTSYSYDSAHRIRTITDARGIVFLTNDSSPGSGRVLRQVQADGGVWQFHYQLQGPTVTGPGCPGPACPTEESSDRVTQGYTFTGGLVVATTVIDPRGQPTTYRFNNGGFESDQVDGLGQRTRFTRDAANQVTASTDPLSRATAFTYDVAGNTTAITDPDNKTTRFTYEPTFNRVTTITDALNQITAFTYDPANGTLLTVKDPLNQVTTISYNAVGQPTSVQGPIPTEPPTTFAYDADGNLITTTDPLGHTTLRAYDAVSRLIRLTDPRGFSTQFGYDALNRVRTIADARHGVTRFTYDGNGNLLTVSDAKGQTTTYTYDNMDRLLTRTDPLGRIERYAYDLSGNLVTFTDRKPQVSTHTYDALNRRISSSFADGSTVTYVYDAVGRLVRAIDSVVGAIDFFYDTLDRLVQEITAQGSITYTYDGLGRRTGLTANGQQPVTYGYDAASRLVQVQQGTQTVGLAYDPAGRRTSLTYPNGTNTTYGYDAASRLLSLTHNGPAGLIESLTYAYDAAGNRISLTRANGAATLLPAAVQAAYDAANEQIQFNSLPLTYDLNGNLTSQTDTSGTTIYTWDARNRLAALTGPALSASFAYDALGRRVSKTINGQPTQFLYDGNDIIAEIQGGAVAVTYFRSLNIDEMFGILRQDGAYFSIYDGLGSTLALTDQTGAVAAQYTYEPFGRTQSTNPAFPNPFQFTGRENDGTGLYYYRARYYSPQHHRFISEDPLRALTHLYTYVGNQPLQASDPFGLYTVIVRGGVGSAPIGPSQSGASLGPIANDLRGAGQTVNDVYGTDAAAAALADLRAHQGDPTGVHVVCHSRGCDKILDQLNRNPDVKVDRMVTLDCFGFSGTCGTIPNNVGHNLNYWQDGFLGVGPNRRGNGGGAGITNVQRPESHSGIPQAREVRDGVVACVANGQCRNGGEMGGRK